MTRLFIMRMTTTAAMGLLIILPQGTFAHSRYWFDHNRFSDSPSPALTFIAEPVPTTPASTPPVQSEVRDAELERMKARQAKLKADCDRRIAELTQKGKLNRKAEVEEECAKRMAAKEEREAKREAVVTRKNAVEEATDARHDATLDAKRKKLNAKIADIRSKEEALKQDCASRKAALGKQGKKGRADQLDQQCDTKLATFAKQRNNLEAQVETLTNKIAD